MTVQFPSASQALCEEVGTLRKWLDEDALPLWWEVGSARPDGGFYERLGQDAKPVFSDDRRARVQPRQAYCFAAAGQHGWQGPWKDALLHGLSWFEKVYRLDSGLYGNLADQTGRLIDPTFDLYNQAFALFAAAQTAASL
ncbi:AGE family epimerase/isomerase, partial [Rhizobium sp. UGM030330-04]|uniref:AGE family epimerase/isomerase n=1 Tax=Rhizobium sp. UGM030330-04 TaxID=1378077 RepID=UPI000D835C71